MLRASAGWARCGGRQTAAAAATTLTVGRARCAITTATAAAAAAAAASSGAAAARPRVARPSPSRRPPRRQRQPWTCGAAASSRDEPPALSGDDKEDEEQEAEAEEEEEDVALDVLEAAATASFAALPGAPGISNGGEEDGAEAAFSLARELLELVATAGDGASAHHTSSSSSSSKRTALVAVGDWDTSAAAAAAVASMGAAVATLTPAQRGAVALHIFPSSTALVAAIPRCEAAADAAAEALADAEAGSGGEGGGNDGDDVWAPTPAPSVQIWVGGQSFAAERAAARETPPQVLLATPGRLRQHLTEGSGSGGGSHAPVPAGQRPGQQRQRGALFQELQFIVVHQAGAFVAQGSNLRPELEACLRALLPPPPPPPNGRQQAASVGSPKVLMLAAPGDALAVERFCATQPLLGGRPSVVQLSAPPEQLDAGDTGAAEGGQQQQQQQRARPGAQPPHAIVTPQHLMVTQLAFAVRRHLTGRRTARVVIELRSAAEAQLCARLFRLLLRLPTMELHSRKTLSYRRSVVDSFPALRTAVMLATPDAAAPLLAGASGAAATLHVRVGVPPAAFEARPPDDDDLVGLAWGSGNGSGMGAVDSSAVRLLLLSDHEAVALLRQRQTPIDVGSALPLSAGQRPLAVAARDAGIAAWQRPQNLAQQRSVPVAELQGHLDDLASALTPTTRAGAEADADADSTSSKRSAPQRASGARVKELAQLLPSVEAALRRVPAVLKSRAYVAWLSQRLSAADGLGWAPRDAAAAAAVYARCIGCEERPLLRHDVAVRLGVQDLADVRVAPRRRTDV